MLLRGRIKVYDQSKGYGWVEVPGSADHFIHFRRQGMLELSAAGQSITLTPLDMCKGPEVGDWVVFESVKLPNRDQPQASPWMFAEDAQVVLELQAKKSGAMFFECCRLMGVV